MGNLFIAIVVLLSCGFVFQIGFLYYHHPITNAMMPSSLRSQYLRPLPLAVTSHAVGDLNGPLAVSSSRERASLELDSVLSNVPPIVAAWRAGKLDWHELIPAHNSKWEKYGTPGKDGMLRLLASKEEQVTDYLTRFHASGLSSRYGHDHGPLANYTGCDALQSPCMIHDQGSCQLNQLCAWSADEQMCREVLPQPQPPVQPDSCKKPHFITHERIHRVRNASQCAVFVDQPAVIVAMDSESQTMFYHWWAAWQSVYKYWTVTTNSRRVHFMLDKVHDTLFFHYFGLLSDHCWRRPVSDNRVCFCNLRTFPAKQYRLDAAGAAGQMFDFLGLSDAQPPAERAKVGLISRRRKRFILNEYALAQQVEAMGYEVELLPLESMTLFEQLRALRSLDVLIGIHGSGLDNAAFLHPGSVMVQLLPFSVEHRASFHDTAVEAKVVYQEWQLTDRSKTVFHWDLLAEANKRKVKRESKEDILNAGQINSDTRETTMFWINQDIIVPMEEWKGIVDKAVKASQGGKAKRKWW